MKNKLKLFILILGLFLFVIGFANALDCGDTIYQDTVLNDDLLNCSTYGLIIGNDDITLNCDNHMIDGNNTGSSYGIYITNKAYITITNCNIREFSTGILSYSYSHNNYFINNAITNNLYNGVWLIGGFYYNLTGNEIKYNGGNGIKLDESYYNNIVGNTIKNHTNKDGIFLDSDSNYNKISNNEFQWNGAWNGSGVYILSSYNSLWGNTFFENNYHGVFLSGPHNSLWSNSFINNNVGVRISGMYNSLWSNGFTDNNIGTLFYDMSYNSVWSNSFINNNFGASFIDSSHNSLWNNTFFENNNYGVFLSAKTWNSSFSRYNTFWGNNFTNNYINAWENTTSINNNWNTTIGNYWSDFELNYGFPDYYKIWGGGGGIDWHPIWNELPINVSTYIIDNSDPEFMVLSGRWISRNFTNASNGEALYNDPGYGNERVGWQVNELVEPGTYEVYVWKFEHEYLNSMATNAHYQVYHRTGMSYWIEVNQQTPGNEWILLGEYEFDNSRRLGVLMNDDSNGRIIADAIKLVYQGPLSNSESNGPDLLNNHNI